MTEPKLLRKRGLALCCLSLLLAVGSQAQEIGVTEIMEIARGLRFTDGPAWSPVGFLVFSDVPNNRLLRHEPGGQVAVLRENSNGTGGSVFDKSGKLYTAEGAARRIGKTDNDKQTVLVTSFEGKSFNSPNDIAIRRNGDVYFTDPAFGSAREEQELDFHGLYRVSARGEVSVIKRSATRLNGIAFSPDDNTLYFTDTDSRALLAIDVNNRGDARNERELVTIGEGIPSGICVDTKGNIYVAADRIRIYDKNGKEIGHYNVPGRPTNCAFGEADGKALFVTADGGLYRIQSSIPGLLPR